VYEHVTRQAHERNLRYELALFVIADRDKYARELLAARKLAEDVLERKTVAEAALQQAQDELHDASRRPRV
jgi:sigma-B regulation protein RsbU (phosphoserine phosphatase)